jgi:hypothetical protein
LFTTARLVGTERKNGETTGTNSDGCLAVSCGECG